MPILQQNDAAAVARYTEFVTRSPWGNLMQDRGWAHVKKGWVGEQVYLEQNGEINAAMSIIFAPAVAGRTLAYAPRGPVCDPYDTETIAALMREAAPALKSTGPSCCALTLKRPTPMSSLPNMKSWACAAVPATAACTIRSSPASICSCRWRAKHWRS